MVHLFQDWILNMKNNREMEWYIRCNIPGEKKEVIGLAIVMQKNQPLSVMLLIGQRGVREDGSNHNMEINCENDHQLLSPARNTSIQFKTVLLMYIFYISYKEVAVLFLMYYAFDYHQGKTCLQQRCFSGRDPYLSCRHVFLTGHVVGHCARNFILQLSFLLQWINFLVLKY